MNGKPEIKDGASDQGIKAQVMWVNVDGRNTLFVDAATVNAHCARYRQALLAIRDNAQGMLNYPPDQETQDTALAILSLCDGVLENGDKNRAKAE